MKIKFFWNPNFMKIRIWNSRFLNIQILIVNIFVNPDFGNQFLLIIKFFSVFKVFIFDFWTPSFILDFENQFFKSGFRKARYFLNLNLEFECQGFFQRQYFENPNLETQYFWKSGFLKSIFIKIKFIFENTFSKY